jgi:hypothetical protein
MSGRNNRTRAAEVLLDLDGDARASIATSIDRMRATQALHGRIRPLSMHGEARLTVFVDDHAVVTKLADAILHTVAVMQLAHEPDRTLFLLRYQGARPVSVDFHFLTAADGAQFPPDELVAARHRLAQSRRRRGVGGDQKK